MQKIINANCLFEMQKMADNSIDCVLTDPPYGIGFMNKEWDKSVIGIEYWKELLRVCKPGAPILVFGGTRTYHRLTCAIEDAGFQIRDCLMWIYGSGFPKSKACLKPAYEPIILAMKKDKYIHHLNIDKCRIEGNKPQTTRSSSIFQQKHDGRLSDNSKGRWPANVLFDEEAAEMLDQQSGILKSGDLKPGHHTKGKSKIGTFNIHDRLNQVFKGDSGGASRFFYCAKASTKERNADCESLPLKQSNKNYGTGGFSRPTDQPEREQKATPNHHPTVKPLKLMEYLLKLIMPPNPDAIVLDPFLGSGTTLLAAKNLGFNAIGIEIDQDYCRIAECRLNNSEAA